MKKYADSEGSLWAKTVTKRYKSASLQESTACDVAIVGAGFTGMRAALDLVEAGTDVIVIDAGGVGWGASGRNGGQVNPMLPVFKPSELLEAVGPTYFERLADLSLGSADALFDLIRKYDIDCDARQHGWFRVDHTEKARDTARKGAKLWAEYGAMFEFLDGEDVKRLTGSPVYNSAMLAPKGGAVQPLSLICGLAFAAEQRGVRIFEKTTLDRLDRTERGWSLACGPHQITAEKVILATNGYSGPVRKDVQQTILPMYSVQVATDPLPDNVYETLLPGGQTIADTRRGIVYARREPNNRFVYGGIGGVGFSGDFTGFERLRKDAETIFPQLRGANWQYEWGGQLALTADRVPKFLEPEPGLLAGLGYNGRGVAMSHAMGKVLADRALGMAAEDLPFPVSPPDAMPFRRIQAFGASTAIAAMRVMDQIEIRKKLNAAKRDTT